MSRLFDTVELNRLIDLVKEDTRNDIPNTQHFIDVYQYILDADFSNFIVIHRREVWHKFFNNSIKVGNDNLHKSVLNDPEYASGRDIIERAITKLQDLIDNNPIQPYVDIPPPPLRNKTLRKSFFDVVTQNNVTVSDFLNNNEHPELKPFIVFHDGRFVGNYVDIQPTNEDFYECAENATINNPIKKPGGNTYVKVTGAGGATILCVKPVWFGDSDRPVIHVPRVVRAKFYKKVEQIVSNKSLGRMVIGADHCNLTAPIDAYTLLPFIIKPKNKSKTAKRRRTARSRREQRNAENDLRALDAALAKMTNVPTPPGSAPSSGSDIIQPLSSPSPRQYRSPPREPSVIPPPPPTSVTRRRITTRAT